MKIIFKTGLKPHSKERPRFYKGKIFNPKGNWLFETALANAYQAQHLPNFEDKILKITVEFRFQVPKSYSKTKREDALQSKILPRQDVDNLTKSVLDALNGIAYTDDKNIKEIHAMKCYAEKEGIIVVIEEY